MKDIWGNIIVAILVTWGILSTVCSAIMIKLTPIVTAILIVLELAGVTNYGIWTVIGYGILIFTIGLIIFGLNMLFIALNK
jgi:hypothetical protein